MNKSIKILLVVIFVLLENVGLWYVADYYWQAKRFEVIVASNRGVSAACRTLDFSEDLTFVLQKMQQYHPAIKAISIGTYLSYGVEVSEGAGTALIFDKNYKLSYKGCDSDWQPSVPIY